MAGERALPGLGLLGFWDLGSNAWKTGMDTNLRRLSALVQLSVVSRTTPLPGSPPALSVYIVPSGAGSNANAVAFRDNGEWVYLTPVKGLRAMVRDEDIFYWFDGSNWVEEVSGLEEAPADGKQYARKDGGWVEVVGDGTGGGGPPSATHWRVLVSEAANGTGNTMIAEVSFGFEGILLDQSAGTSSSSSEISPNNDSSAFDNIDSTIWQSASGLPQWVALEFPEPVQIDGVSLTAGDSTTRANGMPTVFAIQYSEDDGVSWETLGGPIADAEAFAVGETRSYSAFAEEKPILAIIDKTANHMLELDDQGGYVRMDSASANTVEVPANADVAFPIGTVIYLRQVGAGQTTVVEGSGVTVNTAETLNLRKQGSSGSVVKVAEDEWDLTGDLEPA